MDNKPKKISNAKQDFFIEDIIYHLSGWLKRLWITILILAVLGASAMIGYTYKTYTPLYSASATFTVNVDVAESSADHYNKATAQQLAKTFPNILTSSSLNKIVCHDLGIDRLTDSITASVLEDTNLFTITVKSNNPQQAYNVLSSVITNYPEVAKFIIGSTQLSLIDTSSISTKPINFPNYKSKAIVGALAGAALAIGVIALLALTTSTILRSSDITNEYNIKCLASVPELLKKKRSNTNADNDIPSIENNNVNYKFREGIFTLRNNAIRICKEKGYKSIVVTSTISGEGKSVISLNLALAIAMKGYKTVFVDFDLRVPSAYSYLHINESFNGISDYLKGKCDINSCVNATSYENFYVAIENKNNSDASDLIDSDAAKDFIKKLSEEFEFVIIDSPPTAYLADASVVGDYADAAIYVIAQDIVSRKGINDALSSLDNINAELIGAVLNRITKGAESINHGKYGYRRYSYSNYNHYNANKYNKYDKYSTVEPHEISLIDNGVVFDDE